ncbi:meiosis 1 arrest protein-like [Ptychodera flava]|uniref:meiosis 1 arrest protein-like n=1 Tax=Ptychodera flava TaxID=63121 RepID=UPI00396A5A8C
MVELKAPSNCSETGKLTLKCDLQERIINPNQLPFQAQYSVQMDAVNGKPIMSSSLNKGTGVSVTVHKMRAVKLIKADSVCESVLYGMPLVVRPTTCWKLDWEELDTNQQNFQALCQLLQDKDLFLLAEMETTEEKAKSTGSFNYRPDPPKPSGYFLLLPSQSMTLLIKSVAVNELMLPCDFQVPTDKPLSDAVNLLSDSLNQLEIEDSFNPLLIKSNLCRSLTSSLLKNTNIGRQNIKRKPNIYDSQMSQTTHATRGRGRGGRGMEGSRGQGKAQYPPVTRQPRNRNVSCIPSHQKRYCPPPPPTSSQDIYAFQDFEDFPTEL